MRVPVTPEAVSSHTEWLAYTFKLRQSRTEQRDTHNIYKCVVGGMLRVRLLCKVRKFSPITRSRGDRSPSFSKQKSQYYTPGFIRGLWFYRRYRCSSAGARQRQTRPSYLFTPDLCWAFSLAHALFRSSRTANLPHSLKLRPLDLFSYCSSDKYIPDEHAPPFCSVQTYHTITTARREHPPHAHSPQALRASQLGDPSAVTGSNPNVTPVAVRLRSRCVTLTAADREPSTMAALIRTCSRANPPPMAATTLTGNLIRSKLPSHPPLSPSRVFFLRGRGLWPCRAAHPLGTRGWLTHCVPGDARTGDV